MADAANDTAKKCMKQTGNNHRAEQGGHATGFHYTNHDGNKGKACSLHYRQSCPNRAKADCLE